MSESVESDARRLIAEQLEKLETFVTSFRSKLGASDILSYLDRWEKTTLSQLTGQISDNQLKHFKNARLQQRFELSPDEQAEQLILDFKTTLKDWLEAIS